MTLRDPTPKEAAFMPVDELISWWAQKCEITYDEARHMMVEACREIEEDESIEKYQT